MKPLGEWAEAALWDWITASAECRPHVEELLRRKERETIERCAKLCDERVESERYAIMIGREDASVDVECEMKDMASVIRGLQ